MKIDKVTMCRLIGIVLVILHNALAKIGINIPIIDETSIGMFLDFVIEAGIVVSAYWYNNNHTEFAKKSQIYLQTLKDNPEWNEPIMSRDECKVCIDGEEAQG